MNSTSINHQNFFIRLNAPKSPSLRLFCFPHAGGGANTYKEWASHLPNDTEILALQLPGRESRFEEKLIDDLDEVIKKLLDEFIFDQKIPFIFFGHSLGALISFELSKALRRSKSFLPAHLIVSGATAPQLSNKKNKITSKSDSEFLDKVKTFGGIHDSILKDEDLVNLLLPRLRADFSLFERYCYVKDTPFAFGITTIRGLEDASCKSEDVLEWKSQTEANIQHHAIPGGHFFCEKSFPIVMQIVNEVLLKIKNL